MTIYEFKHYFKNGNRFHLVTGMSHTSFHNWIRLGYVPIKSQMMIESMTQGALKADILHCQKESRVEQEQERQVRMYLLDSLMSRSGREITPDLVQEITKEMMERLVEVFAQDD